MLSVMPNTCTRNGTVTARNSAVPFAHNVEPSGSTNRAISGGIPSSRSATAMLVGSVAVLELVENAVTMLVPIRPQNTVGLKPPAMRTSAESTIGAVQRQSDQHHRDVRPQIPQQLPPELRRRDEYQREHAEGGEVHDDVDDLGDRLLQRVEHPQDRPGLVLRDEREGGAERQGKHDDAEDVEVGRRLNRISRDHIDERLETEPRAASLYPLRLRAIGGHQAFTQRRLHAFPWPHYLHEQQAQRRGDGGGYQEVPDRPRTHPPHLADVAPAGDCEGNGGEHQRNHGHEEQTKENLADGVRDVVTEPLHPRRPGSEHVGGDA